MEPDNRGLDLERELTCSICTEVLYQPLTLLDCLHTFCGSCLKEWFGWQLASSRNSPNPLPPGTAPYTCPSCRAPVRDTKHNATVSTLLEMFLAANPDKAKTVEEKEEMKKKYTPGDEVVPKVEAREMSLRERRVEDEDRRLMDEVRDLSLREVGVESPDARRERRRREEARSGQRAPSSRGTSRDGRSTEEARERRRRREADAERRRVRDDNSPQAAMVSTEERRRRRSNEERSARQRHEETSQAAARQIEHQSSLRSLISSSDIDSHEMEEEILRQIREEGLLDGIDLENIDVNQEDQISERIADAFRKRQEEKARQEAERRRETGGRHRRNHSSSAPASRETSGDDAVRAPRARRTHSRSPSSTTTGEPSSRPPQSMSATQANMLDVQSSDEGRRQRRRTTSSSRSSTTPVPVADPETRPAARSQTDLENRPQSASLASARPAAATTRRSTESPRQRAIEISGSDSTRETVPSPNSSPRTAFTARVPPELPPRENQAASSTSPRTTSSTRPIEPAGSTTGTERTEQRERRARKGPPEQVAVRPTSVISAASPPIDPTLVPAPLSPRDPARTSLSDRANALASGARPTSSSSVGSRNRPKLFPEPSLTCARCAKPHIEYDLHYNCAMCHGGNYNICLSCYRAGRGCLHWFGFGYAAWAKWEKLSQAGALENTERPHMLTANRYVEPKRAPGGAEGRKTLTTDDPQNRLQSGAFCASCFAWANECYWRCDSCNEGDWGFCNICVNQGKSCLHALLPLTYKPSDSYAPPMSPTHDQQTPPSASILTGPGVMDVGPFKPLTFSTVCDICRHNIQPSSTRYHCLSCISKAPNTLPGDYDICTTCYPKLISSRRISAENGTSGWRRCLQGHRMIIVGFEENRGGQRRVVVQDLVGGRGLHEEDSNITDPTGAQLQRWLWGEGASVKLRLVTKDVMKTAPSSYPNLFLESTFPPDGGIGMTSAALWSWYPAEGADDELLFPKGAEVRECKDVNGDWYHGTYMGRRGLFPAPYVRLLENGGAWL